MSKVLLGDNLIHLISIESNSIDLIYLDPPFNTGKVWTGTGGTFNDKFASKEEYLKFIEIRLKEMKRILKETGSIYLHCDPSISHYLKIKMDDIFGEDNFRNEIIWHYNNATRGNSTFAKSHDCIFWYSKSNEYCFNREQILVPYQSKMTEWVYKNKNKETPKGKTPDDVIILSALNAMSKEREGYPTQKPVELLERIIIASSNIGDIVLDPFCGSGTALVAAKKLGRHHIGIDKSKDAVEITEERLSNITDNLLYE